MTTAPTPSRADALIREHRASMHPETLRAWASDAVDELRRLQAAERTLHRLGCQDRGGQEWAPPIGQPPDFDLIDSLRSRIAELEVRLVAEALATAEHKLRADQLTQQHRMQAQMHAQATQQLAELEARKPLPSARVHELLDVAGYLGASARERADFINGLRHGEGARGITGGSS